MRKQKQERLILKNELDETARDMRSNKVATIEKLVKKESKKTIKNHAGSCEARKKEVLKCQKKDGCFNTERHRELDK